MAGRWSTAHAGFIAAMDADVLLLTEVSERVSLDGYQSSTTESFMAQRRHWAAVASRRALEPLPDPHPASAMAMTGGTTYCSSILPWRGCSQLPPWGNGNLAARTRRAVDDLEVSLGGVAGPLVWGGDWNHALIGREYAGSAAGRAHILSLVDRLGLQVATSQLPHRIEGLLSIDHIALPKAREHSPAERHVAAADGMRLSDHDAYVVTVVV